MTKAKRTYRENELSAALADAWYVLKRIEWNGMREGASCCPDCGAFSDSPTEGTHVPGCELAALIGK